MAGTVRDHYEVLGVPRNASSDDIHRAFRTLARQVHPDVNTRDDAAARFQELSAAYAVLHDPMERARYDHATFAPGQRSTRRPTFTPQRGADREVPRFLDETGIGFGPIVIRLSTVVRWLS